VKRSLTIPIAMALTAAALASAAHAANTPTYDGYKSSYPQLHQLGVAARVPDVDLKSSYPQLHQLGVAARVPDVDLKSSYPQLHSAPAAAIPDPDLKSSYPQAHDVLSGAVSAAAVGTSDRAGIDWRDAGFGALVGAAAVGLLAVGAALLMRRHRLPALH
jgi:hypothetical protein